MASVDDTTFVEDHALGPQHRSFVLVVGRIVIHPEDSGGTSGFRGELGHRRDQSVDLLVQVGPRKRGGAGPADPAEVWWEVVLRRHRCAVEQNWVHRTVVESGLTPLECQRIERLAQASGIEVMRYQRQNEVTPGEPRANHVPVRIALANGSDVDEHIVPGPPQGIAQRLGSER